MLKPVLAAAAVLHVVLVLYAWSTYSGQALGYDAGQDLVAFARLFGLLGVSFILLQFVLVSRNRLLERTFGLDRLTRLHRRTGLTAVLLIVAHVSGMILGASLTANRGPLEQYGYFLRYYEHMASALIAYGLLLFTVGFSLCIVRKRLRYETWYLIHLFNYAVVVLALFHQLDNGLELILSRPFYWYWLGLHLAVGGFILWNRFLRPLVVLRRHGFQVDRVEPETPDSRSIYIKGRDLDRFRYRAGQFAKWRFLDRNFIKEEHPFTISVEPNGEYLRLTTKSIGDYTARMDAIPVGTKVVVGGPLGAFTLGRADNDKLLFIAGGIGITPLRAMLGELATGRPDADAVLIYAAKTEADFALKSELEELSARSGIRIVYVVSDDPDSGYRHGYVDVDLLREAVPDVSERDVFLCGPPVMMDFVTKHLLASGVAESAIHAERFSLV